MKTPTLMNAKIVEIQLAIKALDTIVRDAEERGVSPAGIEPVCLQISELTKAVRCLKTGEEERAHEHILQACVGSSIFEGFS
jgi:hypothetical protein